jgi:hypothetical protein
VVVRDPVSATKIVGARHLPGTHLFSKHGLGPGQLHMVVKVARETPRVVECYRITGEDC